MHNNIDIFIYSFLMPELEKLDNKKEVLKAIKRSKSKWDKMDKWAKSIQRSIKRK